MFICPGKIIGLPAPSSLMAAAFGQIHGMEQAEDPHFSEKRFCFGQKEPFAPANILFALLLHHFLQHCEEDLPRLGRTGNRRPKSLSSSSWASRVCAAIFLPLSLAGLQTKNGFFLLDNLRFRDQTSTAVPDLLGSLVWILQTLVEPPEQDLSNLGTHRELLAQVFFIESFPLLR